MITLVKILKSKKIVLLPVNCKPINKTKFLFQQINMKKQKSIKAKLIKSSVISI